MTKRKELIFLMVLGLLLSACGKAQTPTEASLPVVAGITPRLPTAAPTVTLEASPTSVLVMQKQGSGAVGNLAGSGPVEALPSATPLPDPLRFVFPTPGPAPVSAWRPPLYPVPWAPTLVDHFYFSRPIAADEINWPSQDYRYGGEFFEDVVHTGVDIPAPEGTPVLAAGSGKVVWAGYGVYRGGYDTTDPYGQAVTIRHDFGYQGETLYTVYGHLQRVDVTEGQYVESGEPIGLVGETGRVTGPHLHFEVRLGENNFLATRNPELWVTPPLGWGVLAGRIMDSNGNLVEGQPLIVTSQVTGQNWFSRSYGPNSVNPDAYYQENVVVGDLPAGRYNLRMYYAGIAFLGEIEIKPGLVSYFYFYGLGGFVYDMPELPGAEFTPEAPAGQ